MNDTVESLSFASGEPHYFGPDTGKLFGWFHAPKQAVRAGVGVVFCSPWGREELSAHQSIRSWAGQLAAEGWPALHFDYEGCGDSAGSEFEPDAWLRWQQSIHLAVDELKALSGVHSVCLIGIRIGATLAALVGATRADVCSLVAVAPVIRGRGYARELTALQIAGATRDEAPTYQGQALFQSGGFVMAQAARDDLAAMDLTRLEDQPAPRVLLLERDDLPVSDLWCKTLLAQGVEVEQLVLPGYLDMMADPHHVQVPQKMIGASMYWLAQVEGPSMFGQAHIEMGACTPEADIATDASGTLTVHETAIRIPGTPVFGIVTVPRRSTARRPSQAVIWLNAGSTRHIGPSRMQVDLARHWAAQGLSVLRLDLAGLGDSAPRDGQPVNMTYPIDAMKDVRAAIDFMRQQVQGGPIHVMGLCAGAYHGLKAARDGMAMDSLTLINPLIFFDAEGIELDDDGLTPQKVHSAASAYRQSLMSPDKWLKLLSGRANLKVLAQVMGQRVWMRVAQQARDAGRLMGLPLKDDLAAELKRLAGQGLHPRFIFSEDDPGVALLAEQGGRAARRLAQQGQISVHHIERSDHVFTDFHARRELMALLDATLLGQAPAVKP
ncbi:MAG: serine aminopeptidase domain-containing protein [Acidobacteriota bacterium]